MLADETRKLKSQIIIVSSGEGMVFISQSSLLKFVKITSFIFRDDADRKSILFESDEIFCLSHCNINVFLKCSGYIFMYQ